MRYRNGPTQGNTQSASLIKFLVAATLVVCERATEDMAKMPALKHYSGRTERPPSACSVCVKSETAMWCCTSVTQNTWDQEPRSRSWVAQFPFLLLTHWRLFRCPPCTCVVSRATGLGPQGMCFCQGHGTSPTELQATAAIRAPRTSCVQLVRRGVAILDRVLTDSE